VQFLTGQVLEPKILGNAMDMPPITVICALLFWGALWGVIGAILSVTPPPITLPYILHRAGHSLTAFSAVLCVTHGQVPLTVTVQLYLENIDHPAAKALAGMIVGDFAVYTSNLTHTTHAQPEHTQHTQHTACMH
jgi:hypothetical protein